MTATAAGVGRFLRSLVAGLFGLAILIGVPLVLWRFIGNPLDLMPQTWDEARRMAQQRNLTTDLMLGVLACVMWILWLQFVWATVWELLVIGPKAGRGEVAPEAPGVPRFIRSMVSAVSSGLLSASIVASASSAGSLLPDLVASAPVLASEVVYGDAVADNAPVANTMNVHYYLIGDHDRVWDLAGQNDVMLQRILELNSDQVKSPIDFRPGMKIRVPASLNLPEAVEHESEVNPGSTSDDAPGNVVYEVVEGDNLWNISKVRLAKAADGERPSNRDIAEEVSDVVEQNPDVIEDPDLIYPGELLTLRSVNGTADDDTTAADLTAASLTDDPADPAQPGGDPDDVAAAEQHETVRRPEEDRAAIIQSTPAEGTTVQSQPSQPAASDTTLADLDDSAEDSAGDQDRDEEVQGETAAGRVEAPSATPWLIGGAALSSALLGLYLAGRRQQANGFSVGFSRKRSELDGDTPPLLQAIARTADPRFMTWVARRLDDTLAGHGTTTAFPTAMLVTPGRRLEMQWPNPVVLTAPNWTMVDGEGRRWACEYGPDDQPSAVEPPPSPGPTTTAALPTMLSLGRIVTIDDGESPVHCELLVNVEHFGSVAVCGSTSHVFPAVRAMIFELAAGGQVCRTRVTTVDFEVEGADILPAIDSAREADALAMATSPTDAGSTLHVFVIQATGAQLDKWFELARPGTGVALILIGDVRSSRLGSRFVLDDDGTGEFHGLEDRVRVFGLEGSTALALEDMFRTYDPADRDIDLRGRPADSLEPSGG